MAPTPMLATPMLVHVKNPRRTGPNVAPEGVQARSALLAKRYRKAVRARYFVDTTAPSPARWARLAKRVRRFEQAAESLEMPSLWFFRESARLIGSGDLVGAKDAFDAGMAALAVDRTTTPATIDVPAPVDVAVTVPAGDLQAEPRDASSVAALVSARYREALRARYVVDRSTSGNGATARLDERLHRFEAAAELVRMPSLWYFLESARLIGSGDLIGAREAFDAGMAPASVERATAPAGVAGLATEEAGDHPAESVDRSSVAARISARYREALRARYVADHAGTDPTATARLEERLRRFEAAAESVGMPALWYFLESARLIGSGDLTGAKVEFDAGMAAPWVGVPVLPAQAQVAARCRDRSGGIASRWSATWRS